MDEKAQKELNDKLLKACQEGQADSVRALLEEGAQANSPQGLPLIWAAHNGHLAVVEVLLETGADKTVTNNGNTPAQWARLKGNTAVAEFLEMTADQVIYRQRLSNRFLEEIFNFTTLERILLLRSSEGNSVEAMNCTPFPAVADQVRLREAFEKHHKRGGKTDESRVFPEILPKLKMLKRQPGV